MGRRHLHSARTEADFAIIIAHDGDLTVHNGQNTGLADQMLELFVLGVDSHTGIAHHGFGAGGRNHNIAAAIGKRITDIPQAAGLVRIFHLGIGQGGQAVGAPVDNTAALIDQSLVVQLAEGFAHGSGAALIHGETGPAPITGSTHFLLLLHNTVAVLFFPVPNALQEFLAAQIITGQALFLAQILLHLDLRGNTGMIRTGQPQGLVALHTLKADQNILQRGVHGMAHVQLACHIGRRHDNGEGLLIGIHFCLKAVVIHPHFVDSRFHIARIVHFRQFFTHMIYSFFRNLAKQKVRSVLPLQNRANISPWYHLYSGSLPHSVGAFTPCPDNGGHTVAAY